MHILAVGVNYHKAPVHMREKVSFEAAELEKALTKLRNTKSVFEDVILSTCNRTEIYTVCDQLHTGRYYTKRFFAQWFHMTAEDIRPFLFIKEDRQAVDHLFRVTCGMDSMILGETQILGQVRDSFLIAQKAGTTGTFFNELFQEALNVAKRAQEETRINDHPVSVCYAAVTMIRQMFGSLEGKSVLLIGAGEMGKLTLKHLVGSGVSDITVANRTLTKAVRLAERCGGRAVPLQALQQVLGMVDVVISAVSVREFLLTENDIAAAIGPNRGRRLVLIDIGVPRNIDPAAGSLKGVILSDIDDLQRIIEENMEERKQAARRIEPLIDAQREKYAGWLKTLGVVPVITALREKALMIQAETMKSMDHKLPGMTERERKIISKHTKSMINQLLRDPIYKIKELAASEAGKETVRLFADIFNITDQVKENVTEKHLISETLEKDDRQTVSFSPEEKPAVHVH